MFLWMFEHAGETLPACELAGRAVEGLVASVVGDSTPL